MILAVIARAFELAQFDIGTVRKLPDVFRLVVPGGRAIGCTEQFARHQFKVGKAAIGAPDIQDARAVLVLLGMPQCEERQRVGLAATTAAAQEQVYFLGKRQRLLLERIKRDLLGCHRPVPRVRRVQSASQARDARSQSALCIRRAEQRQGA